MPLATGAVNRLACQLGAYRPAYRTSEPQRRVRGLLAIRDHPVRSRVRQIGLLPFLHQQWRGIRVTPRKMGWLPTIGSFLRRAWP